MKAKVFKPSNPMYGGIGYGDDPGDDTHPDLSNLQFALEALHEGGTPGGAPVFKKALDLPAARAEPQGEQRSGVGEGRPRTMAASSIPARAAARPRGNGDGSMSRMAR